MAGARIEVTVDDARARAALNRLLATGGDMTPLMRDIGEHLLNSTRERFVSQQAPDGTPWAPLSETTKRRKRRNIGKILTESGVLRGQGLAYRAGRLAVVIGSPLVYAGTHQSGAAQGAFGSTSGGTPIPFGDIPARPFLGLSDADEGDVLRLVNRFLSEQLG